MGTIEHTDVLIVGAGLSGVGAGVWLQEKCPGKSYVILESRATLGGTWDFFRYPGIRSDSDMHTLGYRFRPWTAAKAIADGPAILEYVQQTAREDGVEPHIRFHHRVDRVEWSTDEARWTVFARRTDTDDEVSFTCSYLYGCSGYYDYEQGFMPDFAGVERFGGPVIHPQHWPQDLDYAGKKVAVIGSGATAVTLVPAMAETAAHVTMVQRSPTYIVSLPSVDPIAEAVRKVLPDRAAYPIIRWKNVLYQWASYQFSRRRPETMKKILRAAQKRELPVGYPIDEHFGPSYNPWDQRLCLVPDGDLFRSLSRGESSIVTGQIQTFDETGLVMDSGEHVDADIVISATGLNLKLFGGISMAVDGKEIDMPSSIAYKGMMLAGIPNFAFAIGYTNASWTLKCDLTSEFMCRVLNHMDAGGHTMSVPVLDDPTVEPEPLLDFQAGYVLRSLDKFPKQGSKEPWKLRQNYPRDIVTLRRGALEDGALRFSAPTRTHVPGSEEPALA